MTSSNGRYGVAGYLRMMVMGPSVTINGGAPVIASRGRVRVVEVALSALAIDDIPSSKFPLKTALVNANLPHLSD